MHVTRPVAHRLPLATRRSRSTSRPASPSLVGQNGQGKTNLVEALGLPRDPRQSTGWPPTPRSCGSAPSGPSCGPRWSRDDRDTIVELEINPGRANRARINRAPRPRPRDVLGLLRTVLFAPEDLALVKGDPSERRRFLDDLLVARTPRLAGVRADYDRVLKQRNALLKSASAARRGGRGSDDVRSTLEVWDEPPVDPRRRAPRRAPRPRRRARAARRGGVRRAVRTGAGPAALEYDSSLGADVEPWPTVRRWSASCSPRIERRRREELDRGVSLVGPHRDDLLLRLGRRRPRATPAHGESWSYALALRLASYDLLTGDGTAGGEPVLILDDVFAELDIARRDQAGRAGGRRRAGAGHRRGGGRRARPAGGRPRRRPRRDGSRA